MSEQQSIPYKVVINGKIIKHFPVDALYPSPYPWISCLYLMEKAERTWKNIFLDDCQTRIVSPEDLSFEDYKQAWNELTGEWRVKERYDAMVNCPLLKVMYGVCSIER